MEPDISILRKSGHFYFALTELLTFPVGLEPRIVVRWTSILYIPACFPAPN